MYRPSYRHWVKLWTAGWFDGTCRFELTMAQRAIWVDLLVMAAQSRLPGVICSGTTNGVLQAYPLAWLAAKILCTEAELTEALALFIRQGRLSEEHGVYRVVSWEKYQSEYQRQKPFRKTRVKLSPAEGNSDLSKVTTKSDRQEGEGDGEVKTKDADVRREEGESTPATPFQGVVASDSLLGGALSGQSVLDAFHAVYPTSNVGPKAYRTIADFIAQLSLDEVQEAMVLACRHTPHSPSEAFRYFCGICWTKIKERQSGPSSELA